VAYSFSFEEDRTTALLFSNKSTTSPSDDRDDGLQSGYKARSTRKRSGRRAAVLSEEDRLLMKLKRNDDLP
jgi:hypothetical protein